jgi:hypothetical protein
MSETRGDNVIIQYDMAERIAAAKAETKSNQAHRLVDFLYCHGPAMTGEVAQACAIANISAAANQIRPALEKRGLTIIADLPRPLIKNRFGEVSQSHEWRLQRIR